MRKMKNLIAVTAVACVPLLGFSGTAAADKLDDVIDAGKLRCGVVLDFPPIGYRDSENNPAGFDVEYCKDLAAAMEVDYEIIPVTWAERLPAIYYAQAVVGKDSGISTFEDMKGKRVAAAVGTVPEIEFLKYAEEWGTEDLYQGYQSENEVFLAVAQGKADAGITTNTAVKPITEQYDNIIAGPRMPWTTDYTSVVGPRLDFGWLNYLNLFVTHQVRSGRYQELWDQFVGGEAPELRIPGVMY